MKYQLVLQWPASSIQDYDTLIAIEEVLNEQLDHGSEVDGHDVGSGEINIFIHTNDPTKTFKAVEVLIGLRGFWTDSRVAYRELAGSNYVVIWPNDLNKFNIM